MCPSTVPRATTQPTEDGTGAANGAAAEPETEPCGPRVRLFMSLSCAQLLGDTLSPGPLGAADQRILDQLWLRSVFIEQWRRTRISERAAFEERADRMLGALDTV